MIYSLSLTFWVSLVLLSLNHDLLSMMDVHTLRGGLAIQLATIKGVPGAPYQTFP
jgi:hypothetical protein